MIDQLKRFGRSRFEFIALIAALMAANALAIDSMLPALPNIGESLNVVNENDRQLVLSSYLLGFGIMQLFIGPISDALGRRKPLFIGLVVFVIASFAATISPNFITLLALRFVQGMGAAGSRVITQSIVRDVFSGRAMAEVMSLVFMVFMITPIVAPAIGQILLLTGPWWTIFIFIGVMAIVISVWAFFRLPETLDLDKRRSLNFGSVVQGFQNVITNRTSFGYAIAGMASMAALFGFIIASQQIFVDVYELGSWFPAAFASMAGFLAVSSFINSRVVGRFGMRRISHFAMLSYTALAAILWILTQGGTPNFWVFMFFLCAIQFFFGWMASNMNSLAMEPLGHVAGTASSVFGFMQTIGGAILGAWIARMFDGTVAPIAFGFVTMGSVVILSVLWAEHGKLFGSSVEDNA